MGWIAAMVAVALFAHCEPLGRQITQIDQVSRQIVDLQRFPFHPTTTSPRHFEIIVSLLRGKEGKVADFK